MLDTVLYNDSHQLWLFPYIEGAREFSYNAYYYTTVNAAVAQPKPVDVAPVAVVADAQPVAPVAPVVADAQPVASVVAPVVADAQPVASVAQPVVADAQPVASVAQPVANDTNAAAALVNMPVPAASEVAPMKTPEEVVPQIATTQ